ncbi:MAG: RING finger domain-containing protein [Candidatus Paceibacterota bacterium]
MATITISFLMDKKITVKIPDDESTVREFLIQIAPLFGDVKDVIWGNDFIWSLMVACPNDSNQSIRINTFENRHKRIRDFLKDGDRVFTSIWKLGSPKNSLIYQNNLLASNYSYDTTCSICLDEFSPHAVYDHILPCNHKLHYRCLAKLADSLCPICNASISEDTIHIVRKYVRDEKPELISL